MASKESKSQAKSCSTSLLLRHNLQGGKCKLIKTKVPVTSGAVFQSSLRRTEFLSHISAQVLICTCNWQSSRRLPFILQLVLFDTSSSNCPPSWLFMCLASNLTDAALALLYLPTCPNTPDSSLLWSIVCFLLIYHSNIVTISTLEVYSLWCTEMFQTHTRFLGSSLCEINW